MKNKWIFYSLCIIVLMGFAISLIFIGLYVEEKTDWFIVVFTAALAFTTTLSAIITRVLLKQTRQAFEIDTFNKIVSSTLQLNAMLRNDWYLCDKEKRTPYIENSAVGMLIALKNIDPDMFKKISEEIRTWNKTDSRTPATMFSEALDIVEKGISLEQAKERNQ